jgi:3-dehydroquinate synthase
MAALPVFDSLIINSHKGPYTVQIGESILDEDKKFDPNNFYLIDKNLLSLYGESLREIFSSPNVVIVDPSEGEKSLEGIAPIIRRLIDLKIRRSNTLIAIGGGITQDITCFIASTLFRGLQWRFMPTTLLAQADSCIGSKSSINLGSVKNILGTFCPPNDVMIRVEFLKSLSRKELLSGIGEILKVHAIAGIAAFDSLARNYDALTTNFQLLKKYIYDSLMIKKIYIELDEFDKNIRNIFNYGHTFGHAIETATSFTIPHGVAVSIGMDMANHIACSRQLISKSHFERMHVVLARHYSEFSKTLIQFDKFHDAISKDKKNTVSQLSLILPMGEDVSIEPVAMDNDEFFVKQCLSFFENLRGS